MAFRPSSYSDLAYGDASAASAPRPDLLPPYLNSLKALHVKTGVDFNSASALAELAIKAEKGLSVAGPKLTSSSTVAQIADGFQRLRQLADMYGARQTSDAIRTGTAYWFWKNVEEPATGGGTSVSLAPPPKGSGSAANADAPAPGLDVSESGDQGAGVPMWAWAAGGLSLVGVAVLGLAFKDDIMKATGMK